MASDGAAGDGLGNAVSVIGPTVFAGAPGHASVAGRVYVFSKTAAGWRQTSELVGSGTIGGDAFGASVAASGNTLVVGARGHAKLAGQVYVFGQTASGWRQTAELSGSGTTAFDELGSSVAVSGDVLVAAARGYGSNSGRIFVFNATPAGWSQTSELGGSDTVPNDGFGAQVAISGNTLVAGATGHAGNSGRAYVFQS